MLVSSIYYDNFMQMIRTLKKNIYIFEYFYGYYPIYEFQNT